MTYLTNLCDIEQIHVGRYTYGPICVETFGCENTKLIIGQFCSVAQNVRFVLGGAACGVLEVWSRGKTAAVPQKGILKGLIP